MRVRLIEGGRTEPPSVLIAGAGVAEQLNTTPPSDYAEKQRLWSAAARVEAVGAEGQGT